jgi:multidrug transporter EmrE-like cation transporter
MIAWLFLAVVLLATVAGQLLFKHSHRSGRRVFTAAAIALFLLAVPFTLLAVRDLGIGRVYIAMALSYVITPLAAGALFGETIRSRHALALALILGGVVVYNL